MTGTYCGALPVLPAQRAPSLLGSRCRLRPLYVPPSTCYGFPAKVCQVASPCRSPDTESLRKRSRCPFSLPTWHGIPAKAFQVAPFCHSPATEFPQKRSRCHFLPSTWHGIPAKAFQVSFSAFHLPRNSCKSVPGVIFCLPPGTEFPRKCSRCLSLPSTCYGITTKVCQVAFHAVHLAQRPCRCFGGSLNKTPFAAIMMAGYHVSGR